MAHPMAVKLAANALIESGHSERQVARQLKISPNSVNEWRHDKRYTILPQKEIERVKGSLVGHAYRNAYRIQDSISDEKIKNANLQQTAMSFAIFLDKARLMENLSTDNVAHHSVVQHAESDREKIMARLNGVTINGNEC